MAREKSLHPPARNKKRKEVWNEFFSRLADALGLDALVANRKPVVAWRHLGSMNYFQLVPWDEPSPRYPGPPPSTVRLCVNMMTLFHPGSLLREMGFNPAHRPGHLECLEVEWTLVDDELLAFADWLPFWVSGRIDTTLTIPLPPIASHVWGGGLRDTRYAWTVSAWNAFSDWQRIDRRLTRGATAAEKLMPAMPAVGTEDLRLPAPL
jgi:hypothetical protein